MNTYAPFAGLILFLAVIISGCETPTNSFERSNPNDPSSTEFAGGTVTGLKAETGSSGNIRLQWPAPQDIVSKHRIEKSLGDSLSFVPIAELDAGELQYIDSTRNVRKNTYYRLSSFIELEGEDVFYGSTNAELTFGKISNEEFEFLDESNSLQLSWNVDVPFFTHFIISSENVLTEQQENSVKVLGGKIENVFEDPLLDIDFETRQYTITGIIEYEGVEEVVIETAILFDPKDYFKPENLEINILNEQDWEVSWEGDAFFATGVEITRLHHDGDIHFNLPPKTTFLVDSLITGRQLSELQQRMADQYRRYEVRFLSGTGASLATTGQAEVDIRTPEITTAGLPQINPNSFTLNWTVTGNEKDLIKEFIIEKPHPSIPGRFQEYKRVNGNTFQYTDSNVSEAENPTYRVRTITTYPSETATFSYSPYYELGYMIYTGMDYVTSIEVSSDKRYIAAVSFRSGSGNSILISDIELQQQVSEITIPSQQISDVKISPDDSYLYFAVPTNGAIYRAEFPSGENVEKVIDDAILNSQGVFHIDISSDGSFLVGTGGTGFVKRWDLDTYAMDFLFAESNSPTFYTYKNIAISPDGNLIGGNNGSNYILDAQTGSILENLPWASANITDVQFSADGNYYVFTEHTRTHIYTSGQWGHSRNVMSAGRAAFHPEVSKMVLVNNEGVFTYDVEENRILDIISNATGWRPSPGTANAIAFIDDDRVAFVNGSIIQIWGRSDNFSWRKVN